MRANHRIDAYGLIFEHILIFLRLDKAVCIAENSWRLSEYPKHQYSQERVNKPPRKVTLTVQSLLPAHVHTLPCDNTYRIGEIARNHVFSNALWWFRFHHKINTYFSNRQSCEIWTANDLCSLLEILLLFSCHKLLHCIPGASGSTRWSGSYNLYITASALFNVLQNSLCKELKWRKIKLQLVHRATVLIMAQDIKGVFVPQSNYPLVLYVFPSTRKITGVSCFSLFKYLDEILIEVSVWAPTEWKSWFIYKLSKH